MTRLFRRTVIAGAVAAGVAAVPLVGRYWSRERSILRILENEFGPHVAGSDAAWSFATDLHGLLDPGETLPDTVLVSFAFIGATNVIRALETGGEIVYLGLLDDVREAPCRNPLSALWL